MGSAVRVGVDVAKDVLQVHAVDDQGYVVTSRQLPRSKFLPWCEQLPADCVVALESCGTAHHWARQLERMGLRTLLIPPAFAMQYRLEGPRVKNDAADAAAICEAASRPKMRFVPVKTCAQQGWLTIHRLRDGYSGERTAAINRLRGLMAEFGLVFAQSPRHLLEQASSALTDKSNELTPVARRGVKRLIANIDHLDKDIVWCNEEIKKHAKEDERVRRAMSVLGIGALGASAIVASAGDLTQFKNGRQFAAWLGLVPSQRSSGGHQRLGGITKRGDRYLRKLLVLGAANALNTASKRDDATSRWALELRKRAGFRKTTVALANKIARHVWHALAEPDAETPTLQRAKRPLFTLGPAGPQAETPVGLGCLDENSKQSSHPDQSAKVVLA